MSEKDGATMAECYHPDAQFEDPVFGKLTGIRAGNMWKMLMQRAGEDYKIEWKIILSDEVGGKSMMEAHYRFGKKKRPVHNVIETTFRFRDGKIEQQIDHFSFHRWASMAMGPFGRLFGWTNWLQQEVQRSSLKLLARFEEGESSSSHDS